MSYRQIGFSACEARRADAGPPTWSSVGDSIVPASSSTPPICAPSTSATLIAAVPASATSVGYPIPSTIVPATAYGRCGFSPAGALVTPTDTSVQLPPTQRDQAALRDSHCCCDPELTVPSIVEWARNPPLDHPPSHRFRFPRTCTRRNAV